jgi:thiosulfate/3-mercaptopyruvate sulfurtransferase
MLNKILYSPKELQKLADESKAVIVDVRDAEEYAKDHIPGAVNIPDMFCELSMTTKDGLRKMTDHFKRLFSEAGISKDKMAVLYEDNLSTRYGGSCRGYFQLTYMGHENVGILDGGLVNWKKEGLPTNNEVVTPVPTVFVPKINDAVMATKDTMEKALDNSDIKLLDNRDKVEWTGESSSPYGVDFAPRKGRIPGAKWIEWYDFMETDVSGHISHFRSPEAVREICAKRGLHLDDDIIIYCFKGARASNTLIAMKIAGFKKIRNYYGSWNEWSRDMSLPIDDTVLVA